MVTTLTDEQAYEAMYRYLQRLYDATGADYLAVLLGDMELREGGNSVDPACKYDWDLAVKDVLEGKVDVRAQPSPK